MLIPREHVPIPSVGITRTRRHCSGEMAHAVVTPLLHCLFHRRAASVVHTVEGDTLGAWNDYRSNLGAGALIPAYVLLQVSPRTTQVAVAVHYRSETRIPPNSPTLTISTYASPGGALVDSVALVVDSTTSNEVAAFGSVFGDKWTTTGDDVYAAGLAASRPLVVNPGSLAAIHVVPRTAAPRTQILAVAVWELVGEEQAP